MYNEKGVSLVETLLTVVIFMTIASTLLPVSYHLKTTLYNKKLEYYASEVAYDGTKEVLNMSATSGVKQIDNVDFYWEYDNQVICIEYTNVNKKEQKKCISQNGELR